MKLTLEGIKNREAWEKAGITLPRYDVEKVSEKARKEPEWVHFGIGNIFRILLEALRMVCWRKVSWTEALPVWKRLIMML